MIQIIYTDYIVGVWMCEQVNLGKVYIFVLKGSEQDEWVFLIKYYYINQNYNLYMNDNDYKNIKNYKNKSEIDLIKMANREIDDLSILFKHHRRSILIGGGLEAYVKISEKNKWLPNLAMLPKERKKSKTVDR